MSFEPLHQSLRADRASVSPLWYLCDSELYLFINNVERCKCAASAERYAANDADTGNGDSVHGVALIMWRI